MKAVWSGAISFGLVTIPIKLYSAVEQQKVHFRLLCEKCKSPIKYKRACSCQEDVPWDQIIKAFEISKGQYRTFTKEELAEIKPEKSDYIEILEFVDAQQIDPIFFHKHYFVGPAMEKEKTYFLFKEVLQASAKIAIGRFVLREKEYHCAIEAYQSGFLLSTLNYAYEIRNIREIKELQEAPPSLSTQELELAEQLVNKLYSKEFNIGKYKDLYVEKLKELLLKKERGEPLVLEEEKRPTEENLLEALRQSLEA